MNYYEHHIGDFAEATAHLSFVEDAAYSRMIRKYYATERPMPVDIKAVQRLIGARTREERDAVQSVLDEFFELQDDGWHQKRCDADLARYLAKQEKARASANARWQKPHSERNADDMRTHPADSSERNANASETHDERNATRGRAGARAPARPQSPVPSPQSPVTRPNAEEHAPIAGGEGGAPGPDVRVSRATAVCIALKAEGMGQVNPGDPRLIALVERGAQVQHFVAALPGSKGKRNPFAYLLATVEGQLQEAQQMAANGRAAPAPPKPQSATERRMETIAGLTGKNRERTSDAARQPGAIDVESRIVE